MPELTAKQVEQLEDQARKHYLEEGRNANASLSYEFLLEGVVLWKREASQKFELSPGTFRSVKQAGNIFFKVLSLDAG